MIDRLLGRDSDLVALQPGVELEAGEAEEGGGPRLVAVRALEGLHDGVPLKILKGPGALHVGSGISRAGRCRGGGRRGRPGGDGVRARREGELGDRDEITSEVIRRPSMAFRSGTDPSRRVCLEAEVAGNLLKSHELSRLPIGIVPQFLRHQRCHARSRLPGSLGI